MVDVFDHADGETPPLPGYRLSKLEIYNWGTFDGAVYSVYPEGQTTLLVGENGSGKSTLVDALLTLLVRPQTRNYNVAAGAMKNERDERTYIRGAYDRTVGESGRPQIQYLRSGAGHYTALLACFSNAASSDSFTLCQILYLNADNSVEKVYAFCEGQRGIVQDLSHITSASAVAKHLKDRGYNTTSSYKQYLGWFQRKTSFRPKAMDIFNQTVAVKDVQRLDLFIRQHMLELKPWKNKVDRLLSHFNELSEAHRMLIRVRQQDELLSPISEAGVRYQARLDEVTAARKQLDACELYFAMESVALLEPLCDKWRQQLQFLADEITRLDELQDRCRNEIARLTVEIEHAGGDRLRQLPGLIEQAESISRVKLAARHRFEAQLRSAELQPQITSPDQFHKTRQLIHQRRNRLVEDRTQSRHMSSAIQFEIGSLTRQLSDDRNELEALQRRKNNLPESLIAIRFAATCVWRLRISRLPQSWLQLPPRNANGKPPSNRSCTVSRVRCSWRRRSTPEYPVTSTARDCRTDVVKDSAWST